MIFTFLGQPILSACLLWCVWEINIIVFFYWNAVHFKAFRFETYMQNNPILIAQLKNPSKNQWDNGFIVKPGFGWKHWCYVKGIVKWKIFFHKKLGHCTKMKDPKKIGLGTFFGSFLSVSIFFPRISKWHPRICKLHRGFINYISD